jgi:transglutaminase-like putative cysteine protease
MIYRLTHTTTYQYTGAVSLSHHVLRLRPRDLTYQRCFRNELHIEPRPDVLCGHVDYFGNPTTFVTIEGSHRKLVIAARSEVEVTAAPPRQESPPWEKARHVSEVSEFTFASPLINDEPDLAAYAAPSFSAGRPVLEAVMDLTGRVYRDFKFDPTATNVATPVMEVFKSRCGVCQDFAQLQIGCLRTMGLAARYVSGYLETMPPPGRPRLVGADVSHAWVSFFCPGHGWVDVDPTNDLLVGGRHITIAWGRDYSDVSPVRGIIIGSGEHSMSVSVDVMAMPEPALLEKKV